MQSDSQLVVNSINGKICVPKEIIDLVEDVRYYYLHLGILELNIVIG